MLSNDNNPYDAPGDLPDVTARPAPYDENLPGCILENALELVFSTDSRGVFTYVNHRAALLGRNPEDLVGESVFSLLVECEDVEALEHAYLSRSKKSLEVGMDTASGDTLLMSLNLVPMCSKDGFRGFIGVGRDVTEKRAAEAGVRQAERLASLGELVSGVAHEINNKLMPILAYSELLQLPERGEKELAMIKAISDSASGAKNVVESLLRFARQVSPRMTPVELCGIIREVTGTFSHRLTTCGVQLELDVPDNDVMLMADRHQLKQVFTNMVQNSCQAMEKAGGTLSVKVRATGDGYTEAEFSDTGPGIPKKYISSVFDPFFTTREVGGGSGLGLSLSYGIVKAHGGDIAVSSETGGARFTVRLPSCLPHHDHSGSHARVQARPVNAAGIKKVLLVEDEYIQLELLCELMTKKGYDVVAATSGEEAIRRIVEDGCDLMVTDIKMPGMDGVRLLNWVKDNVPSLKGRVVVTTGDTYNPALIEYLESEELTVLTKPYDIRNLLAVIDEGFRPGRPT